MSDAAQAHPKTARSTADNAAQAAGQTVQLDNTETAGAAKAGADAGLRRAQPPAPRSLHRGSSRLAAGQLRGMVEEFLTEHPGPHGPVEIGHALGRSSGAIANALERLVETGWAERTSERPKRYRFAEADDLTCDDPGDTEDPEGVDGGSREDGGQNDADDEANDDVARLDRQAAEPES
jgi:hypothetical protein